MLASILVLRFQTWQHIYIFTASDQYSHTNTGSRKILPRQDIIYLLKKDNSFGNMTAGKQPDIRYQCPCVYRTRVNMREVLQSDMEPRLTRTAYDQHIKILDILILLVEILSITLIWQKSFISAFQLEILSIYNESHGHNGPIPSNISGVLNALNSINNVTWQYTCIWKPD